MTNAELAIAGVVILTAVMTVLYLVGRVRANDLDWRRDGARVAIMVGIAVAGAALFAGPEVLALLVVPGILILGGAYMVRTRTDRFTRTAGWVTIAVGVLSGALAFVRIVVLG